MKAGTATKVIDFESVVSQRGKTHFVISVGIFTFTAAPPKFIGVIREERVLNVPDSFFGVQFDILFFLVRILETLVAFFSLFSKSLKILALLIMWMSSASALYLPKDPSSRKH